jgi:hypothetical protein
MNEKFNKKILILFFFSFIHMCIQCLGHFSPLPPTPPLPTPPPKDTDFKKEVEMLEMRHSINPIKI